MAWTVASVDAPATEAEHWARYWYYRYHLNQYVPDFKKRMSNPETRQEVVNEFLTLARRIL